MRSMANASISWGLVNVPVQMFAATESHDVKFSLFHLHEDGSASRIEMPCVCKQCGEVVPRSGLLKGVERGDQAILVTADELAAVEQESGRAFTVLRFVDAGSINPLTLEASYYLSPPRQGQQRAGRLHAAANGP